MKQTIYRNIRSWDMITPTASTEFLQTLSRQLNASLDLNQVMSQVLQLTVEATHATRGSLFLLDEQGEVTHYILARPHQSPEVSRQKIEDVMAYGLAGWVYRQRQGLLISHTADDPRWLPLADDKQATQSVLGVPLLRQEWLNGMMFLHHHRPGFFDESHLALATSIAGQAAIAIENARLFTQVRAERETLSALIAGMPIPVLVINAQEQIIYASQAAYHLLALPLLTLSLDDLADGPKIKAAIEQIRQSPATSKVEINWANQYTFSLSLNELPQLGAVIAFNDITYLKELDALKTEFVEMVSHDLKSPLTAIHGYATLLGMENLSERGRANLANLLQHTEQTQSLILALLDLTRLEAGIDEDIEACNLTEITAEVLEGFRLAAIQKELSLTTELPSGLPLIMGNPMRLFHAVSNLVSNAIKYTPGGGRVFVGLSHTDSQVCLRVADTGPGIPPEEQAKIFEKFYRTATRSNAGVEGSGLGLSIVKAVIERYGGQVKVESTVGEGSAFICTLPILDNSAPS
jgi:signal transduction histidine kinase